MDRSEPTWEQAWRIVEAASRRSESAGRILGVMLAFGLGQGEIKALKGEHFDFERNVLHIVRQKTGEGYDIPLWPHAEVLVVQLRPTLKQGQPVLLWHDPVHTMKRVCAALGLPAHSPRSLRRTYVVHLRERGVHDAVIARLQGHRDGGRLVQKVYGSGLTDQFVQRELAKVRGAQRA